MLRETDTFGIYSSIFIFLILDDDRYEFWENGVVCDADECMLINYQ